ncbi:hypothetical protein ELI17_37320 [Rhizobium ruizarguesonis]|uniref:hypothetical protein n=1 Tax=Rhizobium ruizarguesonis TaxID=2081791 RepID=UPI00103228E4|nr:hypothetical protein [Rhizobium ruizarguesonis]TAW39035.1 hypothetical protein ELI17_37320 [Rhizobium ruizarguesonis]
MMRSRISVLALIFFTYLSTPLNAGMPLIFDDGDKVKEIIAKLQAAMGGLIEQAGGEARLTMTHGYQLSQAMISNLAAQYSDSLDLTFRQLDSQQKKGFDDLRVLINQNQRWIHGDIQEGLRTVQDLNVVINNLAISSSRPIVTRFSPTYISPANASDSVLVEVSGFHLYDAASPSRPSLRVEKKEYTADGATDNVISFVIPRESIPVSSHQLQHVTFDLTLYQNTSNWVVSYFHKEYEPTQYSLMFAVLPENLGSYSVATKTMVDRREEVDFNSPKITVNAPSDGGHSNEPSHTYVPNDGYVFDVNSVSAVYDEKLGWYKGQKDNRYNHGQCVMTNILPTSVTIQVSADTRAKEDAARTVCHAFGKQYKVKTEPLSETSSTEPLIWGAETHFDVHENASQVINVNLFGNVKYEVSASEARDLPFLRLEPSTRDKIYFLRPQREWEPK